MYSQKSKINSYVFFNLFKKQIKSSLGISDNATYQSKDKNYPEKMNGMFAIVNIPFKWNGIVINILIV